MIMRYTNEVINIDDRELAKRLDDIKELLVAIGNKIEIFEEEESEPKKRTKEEVR